MSRLIQDFKVRLDEDLREKLTLLHGPFSDLRVRRKSIDARKRHDVHEVYTVEIFETNETPPQANFELPKIHYRGAPPIIVGSGPAGLFAALRLVEHGIPCTLVERGSVAQKRILGINRYWRYGELDPDNNVCFGEGGAGLYSDGKLITRIKSPYIGYVMKRLVDFGAPPEIEYLSNPHVGSDRIRRVIPQIRNYLQQNGCEILFDSKVEKILFEDQAHQKKARATGVQIRGGKALQSDHILLATGHSATDMFEHLRDSGVLLEGKSFAVGLRIEHPQSMINKIQYRGHADHPKLGSANYRLAHHDNESGVGVYSFCMCPGGYVLSSGTSTDGVVSNGMSNYHRNSPFANAAIVVTIDHNQHFGADVFGGMKFRERLERQALEAVRKNGGTRQLPAQITSDFLRSRKSEATIPTSCPSGVVSVSLNSLLPGFVTEKLKEGLEIFNEKMPGFVGSTGQLHGVESRTSCPIRIPRDPITFESISHAGLYPAGEGAGYAGGITSAAVDGIRIAEAIFEKVSSIARPKET